MSSLAFGVISPDAERYLVTVHGELCWPDADRLWQRLDTLINRGVLLVLDLKFVTVTDSSGIRILLLAQRAAAERAATVRLAAASAQLMRLLTDAGLEDLFDVRPDAATALIDHDDDGAPSGDDSAAEYSNRGDD